MSFQLITFAVPVEMNAEQPRRFRALAYSGDVIKQFGPYGDVAIDLEGLTVASERVPVLLDHDNSVESIAGHAALFVENGALIAEGELNSITEAGKLSTKLLEAKHPIQLSVGINGSHQAVKQNPVTINGRQMSVDGLFRKATIRELSFVAVAADPRTSAHLFFHKEHNDMPDNQELDTLRAQLAEAQARNEELTQKLGDMEAKFAAKVRAEREGALSKFELNDEQKEAMLAMADVQFNAALSLAESLRKKVPEHLFKDTATSGPSDKGSDKGSDKMPLTAAVKAKFNV
jgi:hypothetical protein